MKIIAFAASNSKHSINRQLISHATQALEADVEILDLNDYQLPMFSVDLEEELGASPEAAKAFFQKLGEADALLVSFAEHNGSYTAAYKNLFDWVSRIDMKVFQNKPMVLLATSPGPGGAKNVLAAAKNSAPHFAGKVVADLSVPSFYEVYDTENQRFTDKSMEAKVQAAIDQLLD